MSANKPTFYWGSGSVPCWRPMLVLAEQGLWTEGTESVLLEFSKRQHKTDEMLKKNPRGQLPVYEEGDVIVCESVSICFYLLAKHTEGPQLLSDKPCNLGAILQKVFEFDNLWNAIQSPIVRYLWSTKPEDRSDSKSGYLATDTFTLADVMLFTYVAFLIRNGAGLEKAYPSLYKYYVFLKDRPSVQETWPPHWKGTTGPATLKDLC